MLVSLKNVACPEGDQFFPVLVGLAASVYDDPRVIDDHDEGHVYGRRPDVVQFLCSILIGEGSCPDHPNKDRAILAIRGIEIDVDLGMHRRSPAWIGCRIQPALAALILRPTARTGHVSGRSIRRIGTPNRTRTEPAATIAAAIIPSVRSQAKSIPYAARVEPIAFSRPLAAPAPTAPATCTPALANCSTAYCVRLPAVSTNRSGFARKRASTPAAASFPLLGRTTPVKTSQPLRPVLRRTFRLSGPSLD